MWELARLLCNLGGCLLGTFLARWLLGRSLLMSENRRLHAWIEKQKRAPELGPHRSAYPAQWFERDPDVYVSPEEARQGRTPIRRCEAPVLEDATLGVRPAAPPPTSIPSGGRKVEE